METLGSYTKAVKFAVVAIGVLASLLLIVLRNTARPAGQPRVEQAGGVAHTALRPTGANDHSNGIETYGKLPLVFEENRGQTAREVRYVSHGSGYELFLTPQEAVLALRANGRLDLSPRHRVASYREFRKTRQAGQVTAIRLHLEGANPNPQMLGMDRLSTKVNYFVGSDPKNWHTDVPSYARVKYAAIYPGVDLVFYGSGRRLEYDFIVAPGADPKKIALELDGMRKIRINSRGDLVLSVSGGEVELQRPVIYQVVKAERREIEGKYVIAGEHRVTFAMSAYDRSEPLILDPVLNYSTYLGGTATEDDFPAAAIAVDSSGDAFVAGQTTSVDFPAGTNGSVVPVPNPNSGASYLAELDPTGTKLLYSTYLAGTTTNAGDSAFGVAVDANGKVYVTGVTFAAGFPLKSPLPPMANTTKGTCYVTKLDPGASGNSSLLFSTYLGGTGGEFCFAIAADAGGNAYITGLTDSTDYPVQNPFQSAPDPLNKSGTAFLSRINTTTATLVYSTYLGGNGSHVSSSTLFGDEGFGVAADSSNIAYVVGSTTSTNFPHAGNSFEPNLPAANMLAAAFVSKIDTTKTGNPSPSLIYSTYLAGSKEDFGNAVGLGPNNVTYVTGQTFSSDFPTFGAVLPAPTSTAGHAFVSLVDTPQTTASATLKYSTYLGGTGGDVGNGIKADAAGNAYVTGATSSTDFPLTPGPLQATRLNQFGDTFVTKINPNGTDLPANPLPANPILVYSTYIGGGTGAGSSRADQAFGIDLDSANPPNVYITGETASTDFPVQSPLPRGGSLQGLSDAFVTKLTLIPTLVVAPSPFNFGAQPVGMKTNPKAFQVTNNTSSGVTFNSIVVTGVSPANNTDFAKSSDGCSPSVAAGAAPCTINVTFTPSVAAAESATLVITAVVTNGGQASTEVFNVNLTGTGSNFTLSASPTTLTVAQGAVGTPVTITVNPANGFSSAVALTCTGKPANSMCVLSPTSITPPTTSTLTFTAHAILVPLPISKPAPPLNLLRIVPVFAALMLLYLMRSTQRLRTRLAMVSAIFICVTLAACSGPMTSSNNTAKGMYTLTVTGTSGTLTHNATVTVTVN